MGEKIMSSKKLAGKVAVITGGNSGIGLATAQLFHAEGAKVAIMGRDQKSIDTALNTLSTDSLGFAGDVSSLKDLETFMAKVNERFGRIDTLFVNAGVTSDGPTPVATCPWRIPKLRGDWSLIKASTVLLPTIGIEI